MFRLDKLIERLDKRAQGQGRWLCKEGVDLARLIKANTVVGLWRRFKKLDPLMAAWVVSIIQVQKPGLYSRVCAAPEKERIKLLKPYGDKWVRRAFRRF